MPTSPASSQRAYQLPPGKYQAAIELNRQLDTLHFVSFAWTMLVLAALVRFRGGRRLAGMGVLGVPLTFGLVWVAGLPWSFYRHWLGLSYGLSVEAWGPWVADRAKSGVIETGISTLLAYGAFVVARRSPRRWWLWAWGATVGIMVAATYLLPLVFDPLFYRFTPLERTHPELIEPVARVAKQAGFEVSTDRIFEMNASEKTRTLNAYMTGLGATKRIVLWDTAIRALAPGEIQTVFAHEMGHYALGHIPRSLALGALGLLGVFWLARRQRIEQARLPELLLLVAVVSFLAEPVVNSYSRWQEREADEYELRIMSGLRPDAGANSARVDQIMAEISLDDPQPNGFIEFWLYDHPSTDSRMRRALAFDRKK